MVPLLLLKREKLLLLQGEQPSSATQAPSELLGSWVQALPEARRWCGEEPERKGKAAAAVTRV